VIGKNKYCTVYSIFKEEKNFTDGSRMGVAVRTSANASNRSGDLYIYCVSVLCLSLIHIYYCTYYTVYSVFVYLLTYRCFSSK
jgi:hypothetical protein